MSFAVASAATTFPAPMANPAAAALPFRNLLRPGFFESMGVSFEDRVYRELRYWALRWIKYTPAISSRKGVWGARCLAQLGIRSFGYQHGLQNLIRDFFHGCRRVGQ